MLVEAGVGAGGPMHAALVGALAGPELGAGGAGVGTGIGHRVGDTRGAYAGVPGSTLGVTGGGISMSWAAEVSAGFPSPNRASPITKDAAEKCETLRVDFPPDRPSMFNPHTRKARSRSLRAHQ